MRRKLDRLLSDIAAAPPGVTPVDFTAPPGAPALFAADSVTWRVMKNPVALMIGGIAAVLLELAEPRVRTGVWDFTRFKEDPAGRMRRTGYAALVTTYAPAEAARAMIARVNRMHAGIAGFTANDIPFRADDPELLDWVQATASFGFSEAYCRFVRPLSLNKKTNSTLKARPLPRSMARWARHAQPPNAPAVLRQYGQSSNLRLS